MKTLIFKSIIFSILLFFISGTSLGGIDIGPGFEMQDLEGSTINYSGTVGTSSINLPTSADKNISEVMFKCPYQTPLTIRCQISYDGTTYFDLMPGEFVGWSVKGFKKQIKIKANHAGVTYQTVINFEAW